VKASSVTVVMKCLPTLWTLLANCCGLVASLPGVSAWFRPGPVS
jgi:hypothetical protein